MPLPAPPTVLMYALFIMLLLLLLLLLGVRMPLFVLRGLPEPEEDDEVVLARCP